MAYFFTVIAMLFGDKTVNGQPGLAGKKTLTNGELR